MPRRQLPLGSLGRQLHAAVGGRSACGQAPHPAGTPPQSWKLPTFPAGIRESGAPIAAEGLHGSWRGGAGTGGTAWSSGASAAAAKFPVAKSLDSFDFKAIPALNKAQVQLARCEWIERRENVDRQDPCRPGARAGRLPKGPDGLHHGRRRARVDGSWSSAASCGSSRLQTAIIDELGFVPLSKGGSCSSDAALRAGRHAHHLQPPFRRMHRDLRLRAPDRGTARPSTHRQYPRDERDSYPPQPKPARRNSADSELRIRRRSAPAGNVRP